MVLLVLVPPTDVGARVAGPSPERRTPQPRESATEAVVADLTSLADQLLALSFDSVNRYDSIQLRGL